MREQNFRNAPQTILCGAALKEFVSRVKLDRPHVRIIIVENNEAKTCQPTGGYIWENTTISNCRK